MRTRSLVLLVFFAALLIYLPFNANLAVTDPVESNYALPAKEMVISGDFVSPQIYGHAWFDKPIMIYVSIALCYKLFGINEFAARFPAALASALSVAFLCWFTLKLFKKQKIAVLSALVLATSLEFWILSRMVITDALLFLFTSVSLGLFYLGLSEGKIRYYVIAYMAAGLSVLTKGPVGIVLPMLIIFVYLVVTRQWKLFRQLFLWRGLVIFLVVAGPWYLAMYQRHGLEFINTFLGLHNYVRATVSEHPQDNVFYYYLVLFPFSMLPWSGLLFKALGSLRMKVPKHAGFLAVWLGVIIVFYTLMATKYPTYVFPAMFPAAILIAREMYDMLEARNPRSWWWLTIPTVVLLAVLSAGKLYFKAYGNIEFLWGGCLIGIIFILWLQIKSSYRRLPETVAAVTVVISFLLIQSVLIPLADRRSARIIVQNLPKTGAIVGSYGNYATSAVFYSGYTIPLLKLETNALEEESSWSGKYTMPKETLAAFRERTIKQQAVYLLATDDVSLLEQNMGIKLLPVAEQGTKRLYQLNN